MPRTKGEPKPPRPRPEVPEEPAVLKFHRHWYTLARASLPFLTFLGGLVAALSIAPAREFLVERHLRLVLLLAILPSLGLLWRLLEWARSGYLLTSRRIIHLERGVLFFQWRQEIPLVQVVNVAILPNNSLDRVLDFDDLAIELEQGEPVVLPAVPDPERVRSLILGQVSQARALERRHGQEWLGRELKGAIGAEATLNRVQETSEPVEKGGNLSPEQWAKPPWRRHWVALLRRSFLPLGTLVLLGYLWLAFRLSLPPFRGVSWRLPAWAFISPAALFLGWIAWQGAAWWGETYALTSERLLGIKWKPLSKKQTVSAWNLADIQNISCLIPGALAWLLGYGEIRVELAHPQGTLVLRDIPHPQAFRELVFRLVQEAQGARTRRRWQDQKEEALGWLSAAERDTD